MSDRSSRWQRKQHGGDSDEGKAITRSLQSNMFLSGAFPYNVGPQSIQRRSYCILYVCVHSVM
jgi:hypothetical protein